jgi:hypothetical protein
MLPNTVFGRNELSRFEDEAVYTEITERFLLLLSP